MKNLQFRKKNRWQGHDYSENGYYFVTICTKGKMCWFGEIFDNKMVLNECGKIVENSLLDLPSHYEKCSIDSYVIMPNHLHVLIFINDANVVTGFKPVTTKAYSLSEIIRGLKTFSSRRVHELNHWDFSWQRSFHDRVIRNDKELENIREYISNNPLNWNKDELFPS